MAGDAGLAHVNVHRNPFTLRLPAFHISQQRAVREYGKAERMHFSVVVSGDNVEQQMGPFPETNIGPIAQEFMQNLDHTDQVHELFHMPRRPADVRHRSAERQLSRMMQSLYIAVNHLLTGTSMIDPKNEEMPVQEFLAVRKEAGSKIDPETATVMWIYAQTLDPYGILSLAGDSHQVGRECFARSPDSDIWVWFHDLPEATRETLWRMHRSRLAFPSGIEHETKETE